MQVNSLKIEHKLTNEEISSTQYHFDSAKLQADQQIQHLNERNQLQIEAE